jgi:hypothetical protein
MAEDSTKNILKTFGNKLTEDIKKAIPRGTGATQDSVYIEFTKTGFIIRGGAQIGAIIDGRKPTGPGAKKGNPTVQESVLKWIKAKGIRPKESSMSEVSLSWAIANSIHKNGYKGKGNIFKNVITSQRIASLTTALIKNETTVIQSQIIKDFKFK